MIDVIPHVVSALSDTGLKVYNENFITKDTKIPCITYYFLDDSMNKLGDTMEYSYISFYIKLYANTTKELASYSNKLDKIAREIGLRRIGCEEVWVDNLGCRTFTYRGLALEIFE